MRTLKIGDYIEYCTNPRLKDRRDFAFIHGFTKDEDWNIRIIQIIGGNTLPEHKDYLFNNPEDYITSHISAKHIK